VSAMAVASEGSNLKTTVNRLVWSAEHGTYRAVSGPLDRLSEALDIAGYVRLLRADLVVHERCYERRVTGSRGARSRLWRDEEGTAFEVAGASAAGSLNRLRCNLRRGGGVGRSPAPTLLDGASPGL